MAEEYDPKLTEWTERLDEGETGARVARDSLFEAVCSALGASPMELAAATTWTPRRPTGRPVPAKPEETTSSNCGRPAIGKWATTRGPGAGYQR